MSTTLSLDAMHLSRCLCRRRQHMRARAPSHNKPCHAAARASIRRRVTALLGVSPVPSARLTRWKKPRLARSVLREPTPSLQSVAATVPCARTSLHLGPRRRVRVNWLLPANLRPSRGAPLRGTARRVPSVRTKAARHARHVRPVRSRGREHHRAPPAQWAQLLKMWPPHASRAAKVRTRTTASTV